MTGKQLKHSICVALLGLSLLTMGSCNKSDSPTPENPAASTFTAADFQLTINEIYEPNEDFPGEDYIRIDYAIKNVSNKTLERGITLHWKVKAADGAYYETTDKDIVYNNPLNPGASVTAASVISLGKPQNNPDRSTLVYTLTP